MASLQGKNILIIDDAPEIRLLVKRILAGDGATITEAATVEEGLSLASTKAPHLILTDLSMPGKNGFDFLRARRGLPPLLDIPAIVLSGSDDRKSVSEAISLGATDYILKPIRASLLLQKVRKRLRARTFSSHRFKPELRPRAEITLPVDILSAGEAGLRLDCAAKLSPNATISLAGDVLALIGAENLIIRTASAPEPYLVNGRYVCELNFVGIGEGQAKILRKKIAEWGS